MADEISELKLKRLVDVNESQRIRLIGLDLLAAYVAEQLLAMQKAAEQKDPAVFAAALTDAQGAVARMRQPEELRKVAAEQPRDPRGSKKK